VRAASEIALVIACIALAPVRARADAGEDFERGRTLLAAGNYAEACAAFERSMEGDPQNGTLYNLANCYAKRGKVASAWRAYRSLAERDGNPKRREDAARRAGELEPGLPRLRLVATSPGWSAKLDGDDVTAALDGAVPVDPGEHILAATRSGGGDHRETLKIDASGVVTVELSDAPPRPSPREVRRRTIQIAWIGGGALVAIGLGFGIDTIASWGDAKDVCGGDTRCPDAASQARATLLADGARRQGTVATALVLAGGAAIGVGVWYWRRDRRAKAYVAPGTDATPIGITLGRSF
jgi:hypothetical protein